MTVAEMRTAAWHGGWPLRLKLSAGWRVTILRPSTSPAGRAAFHPAARPRPLSGVGAGRRPDPADPGGPATATARRPIWLYAPGRDPADLPAEIPGMTAVAAWQDALARINQEQDGRRNLEVVVYPCAPLQVLEPAGQPAAAQAT